MEHEKETPPPYVALMALTCRLNDLQQSGLDAGTKQIRPPQIDTFGARRSSIVNAVLQCFEYRLISGAPTVAPLAALLSEIEIVVPNISMQELGFCMHFMSVDSEVRWLDENDPTGPEPHVRAWTRLLEYDRRADRVKLTRFGRMFLRIQKQQDAWMFEDRRIEMVQDAIRAGMFEAIPGLCRETIASIRGMHEQLTAIRESPSLDTMAARYINHRDHFTKMIDRSINAAIDGKELLRSEATQTALSQWIETKAENALTHADFRESLDGVHRAVESLKRSWSRLIGEISSIKRVRHGVIDFGLVLDDFVVNPPPLKEARWMLDILGAWKAKPVAVSVADCLQRNRYEPSTSPVASRTFTEDLSQDDANMFRSWLLDNLQAVLRRLENGPCRLSEFLDMPDIAFAHVDDIHELFGAYTIEDGFGEHFTIHVGLGSDLFVHEAEARRITFNDLAAWIADQEEEVA